MAKCDKDFGPRNVAGFEGLNKLPREIAWKYSEDVEKFLKIFIEQILKKIDKEEKHLADNQELIKRAYWTEGYYNGRISALEDCLDVFMDVYKKLENER